MLEGISTSRNCLPFAQCLVAAGKKFVFRYYSRTTTMPQKRMSALEAIGLARAGLDIAAVYQDNARTPDDFGQDRGRLDGAWAQAYAVQIGQPANSAIYFAVDVDFSAAQIKEYVLPYFKGVKAGMDEAAGGTSQYTIGVYGSGLTCQLVRENYALAKYTWLAEATGWRGSDNYAARDVLQHRNDGVTLCGLGSNWERCEANNDFGQFKPIGTHAAVAPGPSTAVGTWMRVTASQLNLRSAPSPAANPPIAQMPEGAQVQVLAIAADPWLQVRVRLGGTDVTGYASAKYLTAVPAPVPGVAAPAVAALATTPNSAPAIPPVHYRENDPQSQRASAARRAQPIGEAQYPTRDPAATPAQRVAQLGAMVEWLAVDTSRRYQRDDYTYCNVYAADFCYLAGVYLPRTWWTGPALVRIAAGQVPPISYGTTIREMRADDLHQWLLEFGAGFGWRRVFDLDALQAAANGGGVGIICADRETAGKPGHITVVVPETATMRAKRDAANQVTLPLQTQAGALNYRYSTIGRKWWEDPIFISNSSVFFVHE